MNCNPLVGCECILVDNDRWWFLFIYLYFKPEKILECISHVRYLLCKTTFPVIHTYIYVHKLYYICIRFMIKYYYRHQSKQFENH